MSEPRNSYLRFEEVKVDQKTKVWRVYSIKSDILLGQIQWFGRFRKYCFFSGQCIFDNHCLIDITMFLENEMSKWYIASRKGKPHG